MQRQRTYPCGTPRPAGPPVGPTRRQFVQGVGVLVGAAAAGCASKAPLMIGPSDAASGLNKTAIDRVTIGSTGIVTSRLALGSGTHGFNGSSDQTRLGVTTFATG